MEDKTVKFENLSGWLKAIVIISWIMAGIWGLAILIGMIEGMLGV